KKAKKGKSHYTAVKEVEADLENKLTELQTMLKNHTYTLTEKDYKHEIINDNGKERDLYKLPYFPHRVVQWAIMNVAENAFMSHFIKHTYASLKGRGIHKAKRDVEDALKKDPEGTKYCLKLDIKKFYPNINNNILMELLKKRFKDKELLDLFEMIVFSRGEKGQPIGSLLSQYLGNYYLSEFDHHCKEKGKLKHYFRYCDDIVILLDDKERLHRIKKYFDGYFKTKLDLEIKGNWQIFPTRTRGIDFVGYRFFGDKTIVRKRIYLKARYVFSRPTKHKAMPSYKGWFKYANCSKFMEKHNIK
ncbi:MAG: reverse transcriptase domain-containing protein, partial [Cetobacterium sp.]